MKKILLLLLLATLSLGIQAQEADDHIYGKDVNLEEVKNVEMPKYPGGLDALMDFLRKNVKYPSEAEKWKAEGRVIMSFVVEKDGSLTDIIASNCKLTSIDQGKLDKLTLNEQQEIKERIPKLFAKEGYRVLRIMQKWEPGLLKDEATGTKSPVRVKFNLPITFRIPK
ncbi:MAG: TonB-dependent receptor [Prevotella sp.]|nr:TonB-dependent receptor [Prevotella sp.]